MVKENAFSVCRRRERGWDGNVSRRARACQPNRNSSGVSRSGSVHGVPPCATIATMSTLPSARRVGGTFAVVLVLWCDPSLAPAARRNPGVMMELRDRNGQRFERLEASGIAFYRGKLLVVDDIVNSLFVFHREGTLAQIVNLDGLPPSGAKFEDLAVNESGGFFAVGSHSGTDREFFEATSVLVRFGLSEGSQGLRIDKRGVEELPLGKSFETLGLWRPGGMKIEGLALDPVSSDLYVGLREPNDRARIYRVSIAEVEAGVVAGMTPVPELEVAFDAGSVDGTPFCVSALLWIPDRQGLLIATSTENEETHRFAGNRLWFYSRNDGVRLVLDTFDVGLKAEGLALGEGNVFISYDNDQDDTEIPSQMRVVPLAELPGFENWDDLRLSGTTPK